MHWTTHIITGASLGYVIGKPFPAELAGIASHMLLDMTPHHDPESDLVHSIDTVIGLGVLRAIAKSRTINRIDPSRSSFLGAVGGALPDFELIVKAVKKDFNFRRFFFPSHNGVLPHGETDNKLFAYSLETLVTASFVVPAWRKYKKLGDRSQESEEHPAK